MNTLHGARLRLESHTALRVAVLFMAAMSVVISPSHASPDQRTGTVTGRIVRSDGPKYEVHVMDQVTWATVVTQPDGKFLLERLPVGDHEIRIVSNYCDVQLIPVTVRAAQVSTIDVQLTCGPRPCPKPNRGDPTCVLENPEQRQRVGTFCQVHHRTRLKLDVVPIHYGIVGYTPGLGGDERNTFPNARPWWTGGCVIGDQRWAEVAYCSDCRASYERLRHGR